MMPTMPALRQREVHVVDQQQIAITLAHIARLHDHVAEARARRNVDLDAIDLLGGILREQFLVRIEARLALGLACARGHADPLELALQRALALGLLFLLDGQPLLLLVEPGGVVPFPGKRPAAIELQNPAGDVVEEVAIVRDRRRPSLCIPSGTARATPTDSASRWLVGSSSSSRSGDCSSSRHSATRRFSPPESFVTSASAGGSRRASIACSSFESRSQAPAASIASCTFACSSSSFSIASGDMSSPNFALISSKRVRSARIGATPSSTLPNTFLDGSSCGSCGRYPTVNPDPRRASPMKRLIEARHDLEQRGLAGAVAAEHADLGAVVEGEIDVFENFGVGRVSLAQPLHGVNKVRHKQ